MSVSRRRPAPPLPSCPTDPPSPAALLRRAATDLPPAPAAAPAPAPATFITQIRADYKALKDLIKASAAEEQTAGVQHFSPRTTSLTVQRAADRRDSGGWVGAAA